MSSFSVILIDIIISKTKSKLITPSLSLIEPNLNLVTSNNIISSNFSLVIWHTNSLSYFSQLSKIA